MNFKIRPYLLCLVVLLCGLPHVWGQVEGDWNELKGTHFIVHYRGSGASYPMAVMKKAEQYYNRIASDLGYPRRSQFWLWENRCKIFLYPTRQDFLSSSPNAAAWSSGFAVPGKRMIVSYEGAETFLDSILPHELAHLVFRDFVGLDNASIPLWLDEGIAMSQELEKREIFDRLVRQSISEKKWIPADQLNGIRSIQEYSTSQAAQFYAQSQSMVRFLLKSGGPPDRFIQFCRDLRDGKNLDEAFSSNYQRKFPSVQKFEEAWVQAHA